MRARIVGIDLALHGLGQLSFFFLRRCIAGNGIGRCDAGSDLVAGVSIPHAQHDRGAEAEAGNLQAIEKAAARQPGFIVLFRRRFLLCVVRIIAHVIGPLCSVATELGAGTLAT